MSEKPEESEFTFRSLSDLDGLRGFLGEIADTRISVTCTLCGNRVEGPYKDLLNGVQCKCGETVRLQNADSKPKRKRNA